MVWQSREGKYPPQWFVAALVAHLYRAYPGVQVSAETMATLWPFFVEAWQNGKTVQATAESTCACDGRHIVPSPATQIRLLKGEVRAPKGAQRGEVFGPEDLREAAPLWKQRNALALARAQAERALERAQAAEDVERRARAATTKEAASKRRLEALRQRETYLQEAAQIDAEIKRLEAAREAERERLAEKSRQLAARIGPPKVMPKAPPRPARKATPPKKTAAPPAPPAKAPAKPAATPPAAKPAPPAAKPVPTKPKASRPPKEALSKPAPPAATPPEDAAIEAQLNALAKKLGPEAFE